MADAQRPNEGRILFDREDLARTIDLILEGDEHAPLLLGHLFVTFRQAIDSGLHGINQTRQALADSIELIYPHSPAHQAALNLYRLSVEGQLKVEDEPVELINAAIQRTRSRAGTAKPQLPRLRKHDSRS
jgi:hypothetical protein